MRKNSVRKWLHAILDLLPLFVIPIFAIYTRNENYNSNIEIEVQENIEVNFNQFANETPTTQSDTSNNGVRRLTTYALIPNHTYYITFELISASNTNIHFSGVTQSWGITELKSNIIIDTTAGKKVFTYTETQERDFRFVGIGNRTGDIITTNYMNIIDLTIMFGYGNEPSDLEMANYYPNMYYDFTLSHKEIIEGYIQTYNDTDIGSQFVYTLYNATDKYFNCTNLFNLEQVWNWVQLNLFGGNAPLMVYVVWQVIIYEFFMDLIFLLYSVFMFVIDFATNCIDRFTGRANRC